MDNRIDHIRIRHEAVKTAKENKLWAEQSLLNALASEEDIPYLLSEVESLKKLDDAYPPAARTIALWLKNYCDNSLPYPEMIADAARKSAQDIERLTAELEQYRQMERDGLLVRLPCKVGDTVYSLGWIKATIYFSCHIDDNSNLIPANVDLSDDEYGVLQVPFEVSMYDEIGKTVFLTEQAAKESLQNAEEIK